jgi:hypothetical protein
VNSGSSAAAQGGGPQVFPLVCLEPPNQLEEGEQSNAAQANAAQANAAQAIAAQASAALSGVTESHCPSAVRNWVEELPKNKEDWEARRKSNLSSQDLVREIRKNGPGHPPQQNQNVISFFRFYRILLSRVEIHNGKSLSVVNAELREAITTEEFPTHTDKGFQNLRLWARNFLALLSILSGCIDQAWEIPYQCTGISACASDRS